MPAFNKLVRIHCKAGAVSARLIFKKRDKCQDFVVRCRDDGITHAIDSPFCCINTTIIVHQYKSIEDRDIGNIVRLYGENWLTNSKFASLMETKGHSSSWRHLSLSIKDRRNGVGKPMFLHILEADNCLPLCVPGIPGEVLQTDSLSNQEGQCVMARLFASSPFAAWRVEAPFSAVSRFDGFLYVVFAASSCMMKHLSPGTCEVLSCLFFSALWLQVGMDAGPFFSGGLRCITWNTRGLVGSVFSRRRTERSNSKISGSSLTTTTSYGSRRCVERTRISRLFRCRLRGFFFFWYLHSWKRKCRELGHSA